LCFAQISLQRNDAPNNGRKQWGRGFYKRVKEEAAELGEVRRHKMWERASDGVRGRRRRRM